MNWRDITENKKNVIFVGESGCGKTELALNCAAELALVTEAEPGPKVQPEAKPQTVNLLDMDQTKGFFRARDHAEAMAESGVNLVCGEHFLDTPLVPPGVIRLLKDEEFLNVLDVGGNEIGAITMGQFAEHLKRTGSVVFFIINPFRIFSTDEEHILQMMEKIKNYGGFESFKFISNPNIGEHTDLQTALEGRETADRLADKLGIEFSAVTFPEWLNEPPQTEVIYIKRYLEYP